MNGNIKFFTKFSIAGLPELPNKSHGHWGGMQKKRERWHNAVERAAFMFRPKSPLTKCKLILERHASRKCDYDNLVYSFKPVVDGLVHSKFLVDDDYGTILERDYRLVKSTMKDQHITIEIKEL